jgi:hypothetical protein
MKSQLVLQFVAASAQEFDGLIALEEQLILTLPPTSEVDGHDFGCGEFNIFVLTDQPREAFDTAQALVRQRHPQCEFKAAYREMGRDEYVILSPPGLRVFTVT